MKRGPGVGVGAQRLAVGGGALADELARAQRQRHVQLDRRREDADHLRWLALEDLLVDRLESAVADHEARVAAARRAAQHDRHRRAPVVVAQRRPLQQALGLAPDQLGVGVELVHQRLDGGRDRGADVALAALGVGAQEGRDRLLHGEAQLVLPAPGRVVNGDADAQQPLVGGRERRRQALGHHALGLQLARVAGPEARHRGPAADAQIAHPAGAVLEVGLQQEDGVAEAAVARLLLGAQAGHEVLGGGGRDARAELAQQLVGQRAVADHEARVQQRGRGRQIGHRQLQRLVERADRVPGVDLGVPERVQDRLGQQRDVPARAVGAQHQQVQVRVGRQLAAAEPAGGQDGDRRRAAGHVRPGDGVHDGVDVGRQLARDGDPVAPLLDRLPGAGPRRREFLGDARVTRGLHYGLYVTWSVGAPNPYDTRH